MEVLPIKDHADQKFGAVIDGQRVTFRLRYNGHLDRWCFDLSIDDLPVINGRRIVIGQDLLRPFSFGIGAIVAAPVDGVSLPGRRQLVDGRVKVFHLSDAELAEIA